MPPWLAEVLKLLGLMTPFVYAAATYGLFHFLDNKASGPAKRALTERLQSIPPTSTVANFTVEVFDRVYTTPLLHRRALVRSAAITTIVSMLVWYELGLLVPSKPNWRGIVTVLTLALVFNILADYVSLFFVRAWLVKAKRRPILGLVVAAFVGALIIYLSHLVRVFVLATAVIGYNAFESLGLVLAFYSNPFESRGQLNLLAPAVVVHLWFPLFALAAVMAQALGWFSKAVSWMQWFLKQGQHHPFQAVGYLAALIVFVIALAAELWARA
jgi:hypothetical protein